MDMNTIEKALLDRELKALCSKLEKVGKDIREIFSAYGIIKGDHAKELNEYLCKCVLHVSVPYNAGDTTIPQALTHPNHVPECIKKLILDFAVKRFLDNADEILDALQNRQHGE